MIGALSSRRSVDTNKMVQLFKTAKAAMTGVPPKMGEHRELRTR